MGSLSNFLRRGDAAKTAPAEHSPSLQCRPARPDEWRQALRLILGTPGQLADDQQVGDFLKFVQQRNIDLNELWVIEVGGAMVWATLPIFSPGRTMLLFTPADPLHPQGSGAFSRMLEEICARSAARNIQLAQVLLDPGDDTMRRNFEARGFLRMAELIYLHTAVRRPLPPPALGPEFTVSCYSPQTHGLFAAGIIASYQNSMDCPSLNGVRSIEDIIAGHQSSGEFDPQYWFVICECVAGGQEIPRGVLLLSKLPRGDTVELVYLGLAPEARRRGLAEWMMRRAFTCAVAMGVGRLSLAVDSANSPALKLYYRFGMVRMGSKVAMMRKLL